ncbi:helix-turn-helix domain-containing protein [Streptomyces sp. NPDC058572]|uniref:helix-turn-helix transcriptional regulator n=1 Tax=Streptomyces sp. NPDC058572 TaxID=3346546 RepID=UPI003656BEEE
MSTARETEAFARRLREIRDASGRSYGALARRVGVSASTLHRYCAGQTVPVEFAPVERLARLCGCRGEELLALHRLWLRADVERGSRQENNGVGRAPAGDGDPAGEEGVADPVTGQAAEAKDGSPVDPGVSAAASEAARAGAHAAVADLAEDAADATTAFVLGGGRDQVQPAPAAGPAQLPAARRSPARRRAAYGAALVTALVASLVLLPAVERAPLRESGGQDTTAQRPGGDITGSGSAPALRTGSASPDATASGPVDGLSASAGPHSPAPAAPAPRPTTTPRPEDSGTPFTWTTDQHVWQNGCDHAYLVDRGPSAVPPPPAESDAAPWARSVGAVHGGDTFVRVTVQGRSDKAVVLQALRVRVLARRTPPAGNVHRMSSGCGGSITPRLFDVDLDKPRPLARSVAGNDSGEPIPAVSFPYKVSATDPEVLLVTGRAISCDCDWYLELAWSSGGRSGTVRIDDHGRPFRTSGIRGRPVYDYDTASARWVPAV